MPAGHPSLLSWVRGDDSGATLNTGTTPHQYSAIPDRGSAGSSYTQATIGSQPQLSAAWSIAAPAFSGGRRFQHGAAASAFASLHNGTSFVLICLRFRMSAISAVHTLIRSTTSYATSGILLQSNSAGTLIFDVANSGGTPALSISATSALSAGSVYTASILKQGAAVEVFLNGTSRGSGNISSPNAGSPGHSPVIGATTGGSNGLIGEVPEVVIFSATTLADLPARTTVESYLSRAVLL